MFDEERRISRTRWSEQLRKRNADEEMPNLAGGLPDSKNLKVYFLTVDA